MAELGVALVGAGKIAQARHLPDWKAAQGGTIVHVVDLDEAIARSAAQRWDIPRWSTRLEDALDDPRVDAVDLCTPFGLHSDQTLACIAAGKPVFVEKPASPTEAETATMARAADESGVLVLLCENWLYAPAATRAQELIDSGAVGVPRMFCSEHLSGMSIIANAERGGFAVPGSYLVNAGIHTIDVAVSMMGPFADLAAFSLPLPDVPRPDEEDREIVVSARFASGAIGSLTFSGLMECRRPGIRPIRVIGADGYVRFDIFSGVVEWSEGRPWSGQGGEYTWRAASASVGHAEAISHFISCVKEGTPPRTPIRDFVSSNRAVDAILASAAAPSAALTRTI